MFPLMVVGQYSPGSTYFGTSNYIEYHAGDLPIIISAPHGGYLEPASIPDRSCTGCTTVRDSRTEELAYEIDSAVQAVFGGHPHIIINKLARIKLDANREIVEAALGDPEAETAWYEYHDFIQAAKDSSAVNFGTAIFIDLHGHGHPKQRIELGYLLGNSNLNLSDSALDAMKHQDLSSIRHLVNVLNPSTPFSEILRGNECMGEFLASRGYPSVPSATDPAPLPTDPFFSGGYNTRRHGSRDSSLINAIQFELNWTGLRSTTANREAFAQALACALRAYFDQWYFELDDWDPGNLVNSTADSGPGSLRSALLGAKKGEVISFDASLMGDTIRLQQGLQICTDVTILGPGKDILAISGEGNCRIFHVMAGSQVELSGLTLTDGYTSSGQDGGAVLSDGHIRFLNCRLINNFSGDDGGAVAMTDSAASIQLDSCFVINNSCLDDGGAISCINGSLTIHASTIANNYSPSSGGSMSADGFVTVSNSTFSENESVLSGGAVKIWSEGTLVCTNTTFAQNIAGNRGGAINSSGFTELNFCTVVDNVASSLGGGLRVPTGGSCTLENTLVANNTGSSGDDLSMFSAVILSLGHNFVGDTTGSGWISATGDQLGNNTVKLDPLVFPLASNGGLTETVALQAGSPCIDQADSSASLSMDQRGKQRISGTQPDIGAFEACFSTTGIDSVAACEKFTWLNGITYFSTNDTATYTLVNAAGCDSLVSLKLTIDQLDTLVTKSGNTLTASLNGAAYQWLDCDDPTNILVGETSQGYSPVKNGSYAVQINLNGCIDTSACIEMQTVGIIENDFGPRFLIYPNPTEECITIELGQPYQAVNLLLFHSTGQLIQAEERIDLSTIDLTLEGPAGLYFLEIIATGQKRAFVKIVKE